jgi:hypothetical protein
MSTAIKADTREAYFPRARETTPTTVDADPQTVTPEEQWELSAWHRRMMANIDLSTCLRIFGAGATVAAIAIFLFNHWDSGNDLTRYAMLLGQTVLLSMLGFLTSRFLGEPKSARVFIALGLVSTAASCTVLGALLYSTVQWDAVRAVYPGFAFWQADSMAEAIRWMAGSMLLLAPLSAIGYTVLCRAAAKRLSALFLVNALLVVAPVRDPAVAAMLACTAGIISLMVLARVRRDVPSVRTGEGRIARMIAVLPVAIIAGRCGFLYSAPAISVASLGLLSYATLRQLGVNAGGHAGLKRALEALSVVPAIVTATACAELAGQAVGHALNDQVAVVVLGAVIVSAFVDLSKRSRTDARLYAGGGAIVGLLVAALELGIEPSIGTALVCGLVCGATAIYTRSAGFTILYRISLLGATIGFGCHVHFAIRAIDLSGWLGLTTLGVIAIVAAAAIERHGEKLRAIIRTGLTPPAAS